MDVISLNLFSSNVKPQIHFEYPVVKRKYESTGFVHQHFTHKHSFSYYSVDEHYLIRGSATRTDNYESLYDRIEGVCHTEIEAKRRMYEFALREAKVQAQERKMKFKDLKTAVKKFLLS